MGISDKFRDLSGTVLVQVEGFFTERFINLCKINNIKIWELRTLVKGVVRFKISVKEFKKLRKIARKTKCKVIIKEKQGLYFKLFKYRKRKLVFLLLIITIFTSIFFSTFIWKIEITGNLNLSEEEIKEALRASDLYVGKNKFTFNKKETINNLRVNLSEISWAGIEISGTAARVEVVEKTFIDESKMQNKNPGDIVAEKSGVITKIVPENGTAKYKIGSYVSKGDVLIEGKMYSKFIEPEIVTAKGIVMIDSTYDYEKEYKYNFLQNEYTGKILKTIGISINSKEIMLNYLNKNKKYDITKSSKKINVFGINLSFDICECKEYVQQDISMTRDELIELAKIESTNYIENDILKACNDGNLVDENERIIDTTDGIKYVVEYTINEKIGIFVERNKNE